MSVTQKRHTTGIPMVFIKKLEPVKSATASMMPRAAASIIAFDTEGRNILFCCSAGN